MEAVAADRGLTFWSDRTILEKAKRVQRPDDAWDADEIERLFADLAGRAWGAGPDRSDEVPGVLRRCSAPSRTGGAHEPAEGGHLEAHLTPAGRRTSSPARASCWRRTGRCTGWAPRSPAS